MKIFLSILFILFALMGFITILSTGIPDNCDKIKKGTIRIDSTSSTLYSNASRLFYNGIILETGERKRITGKDFNKIHPDVFRDFDLHEKFSARDTFFDINVFYHGNYVSIKMPNYCLNPEAYRKRKLEERYTSIALMLPLFLWIAYHLFKWLNARNSLILIPFFLITTISAQEAEIDTTLIFTAEVSVSSGEVFLYPANTFIAKSEIDKNTYQLKYPEEVLKYIISAPDTSLLNLAFQKGGQSFFSDKWMHTRKISAMKDNDLVIQPTLKIQYQERGQMVCLIKYYLVDNIRQRSFRAMIKCILQDGTWKVMAAPLVYETAIALASTKDEVLFGIITGKTSDNYLLSIHDRASSKGYFSFSTFAQVYAGWFDGQVGKESLIEKYTEDIRK